jgi:hypothetical protein
MFPGRGHLHIFVLDQERSCDSPGNINKNKFIQELHEKHQCKKKDGVCLGLIALIISITTISLSVTIILIVGPQPWYVHDSHRYLLVLLILRAMSTSTKIHSIKCNTSHKGGCLTHFYFVVFPHHIYYTLNYLNV